MGEIRVTHRQNLVLVDVKQSELHELWQKLAALELATPNLGLLYVATDAIYVDEQFGEYQSRSFGFASRSQHRAYSSAVLLHQPKDRVPSMLDFS